MAGAWISASPATSVNRRPAYPLALSTCAAASRMRALVSTDFDSATSSSAGGAASFLLRLAIDRSYVCYSLLPGLHMVHPAGTTTLHSLYGDHFPCQRGPHGAVVPSRPFSVVIWRSDGHRARCVDVTLDDPHGADRRRKCGRRGRRSTRCGVRPRR